MGNYVMVLNCGSSSAKFNLFEVAAEKCLTPVVQGIVEEIGNPEKSRMKYQSNGNKEIVTRVIDDHGAALAAIFDLLNAHGINRSDICAMGHRVVHGGDRETGSVLIDEGVLQTIRDLIPIAPLHNPPNLTGIEQSIRLLPGVPQVAVFDTAFHGTLPEYAYRYAIPETWYEAYGVRKYGFHGTSHMYVARRAAYLLGVPFQEFCGITAHLGNGCSITKIRNGQSVDTSMGFTPLEGVIMGTRSGDIDPALISHVADQLILGQGLERAEAFDAVMKALNKESGLKALGGTNMMQEIRAKAETGDIEAETVVNIYAYRIAKYIGEYWATLPMAHALVFTAGLGENEGYVRRRILSFLENLHFEMNEQNNAKRGVEVVIATSRLQVGIPLQAMVIPTDEEIVIGYDTLFLGHLRQQIPDQYPFELDDPA
jgi:acetate kinase